MSAIPKMILSLSISSRTCRHFDEVQLRTDQAILQALLTHVEEISLERNILSGLAIVFEPFDNTFDILLLCGR